MRIVFYNRRILNNNTKFRTFKSKENIHKKKLGHTMVSAMKASSVTLFQEPEEKNVNLQILITAVASKTGMSKNTKIFQIC